MWLTWLQLTWVGLQLAGLVAVAAVHSARDPDVFALLWRDPMGTRMLTSAAALLAVGTGLYLAGCAFLNRWADRGGRRRLPIYRGLVVGLAAFELAGFYLPAVFVFTTGPAAIQIQRQLQRP